MTRSQDVICEKRNRCGLITLNRPGALNALTYDMIGTMEEGYRRWADDLDVYGVVVQSTRDGIFCSGGDLKALYAWRRAGDMSAILDQYGLEYQHTWSVDRFNKPNVPLIDGLCFGGGVALCLYGTHCVGTQRLQFAMPEVGIGFFPDVGATWFLPRLAGETGMYMALTGRPIGLADAYAEGLVTHCIPADRFDRVRAAMMEAEPVDAMLDSLHVDPGPPALAPLRPVIHRIFSGSSVEDILARLNGERGEHRAWAEAVAAEIGSKSPTSLKVAYRQVRTGVGLTLEESLRLEYRIARRFLEGEEFYEGIRAALIDKDRRPRWSPASLADVSDDFVESFFAPLEEGDIELVNHFERGDPGAL